MSICVFNYLFLNQKLFAPALGNCSIPRLLFSTFKHVICKQLLITWPRKSITNHSKLVKPSNVITTRRKPAVCRPSLSFPAMMGTSHEIRRPEPWVVKTKWAMLFDNVPCCRNGRCSKCRGGKTAVGVPDPSRFPDSLTGGFAPGSQALGGQKPGILKAAAGRSLHTSLAGLGTPLVPPGSFQGGWWIGQTIIHRMWEMCQTACRALSLSVMGTLDTCAFQFGAKQPSSIKLVW